MDLIKCTIEPLGNHHHHCPCVPKWGTGPLALSFQVVLSFAAVAASVHHLNPHHGIFIHFANVKKIIFLLKKPHNTSFLR